jgi:phosphoserine/homoserine phosphotransferase
MIKMQDTEKLLKHILLVPAHWNCPRAKDFSFPGQAQSHTTGAGSGAETYPEPAQKESFMSNDMYITCLDLEGVLVPEIWIAFAEASGIPELKRTTRDEPDYDKLMKWRLGILKEHNLGLKEIQDTIARIDPMPGAKEFLDELRSITQVIIISDTFTQFAAPLMKKLGWPTIFCNTLEVAPSGEITGFKMRCEQSKLTTVRALQSAGFTTIASGDSHNDLAMIKASKAGFLFRSTEQIKADNPGIPAYESYGELLAAIKKAMN